LLLGAALGGQAIVFFGLGDELVPGHAPVGEAVHHQCT
jgi:hypothetical protein